MSVTPVSTAPFGAAVPIPGDAAVTFTARDLGGGASIVAVYSVRNSSSIRVSSATATKAAAIGTNDTVLTHTVHLEYIDTKPTPSGLFFIEAIVMEDGQPVFPCTWTAQVAGAPADNAVAKLNLLTAAGVDLARGARVAKERAAAMRAAKKLFAKNTDAKKARAQTRDAKKRGSNKRGKNR